MGLYLCSRMGPVVHGDIALSKRKYNAICLCVFKLLYFKVIMFNSVRFLFVTRYCDSKIFGTLSYEALIIIV